jgi:hypothetical protein
VSYIVGEGFSKRPDACSLIPVAFTHLLSAPALR